MNNWNKIPDSMVRHIWCDPNDESIEIEVDPSWYASNGTPITEETGEDMCYVRTEIKHPENTENLMKAICAVLPDASWGEDNDGQIILYTNKQNVSWVKPEIDTDEIQDYDPS
jgi:hypothetical protein